VTTQQKLGINPKLISIITGKEFSEVESNPGIELLPGKYAQGIAKYMLTSEDYSEDLNDQECKYKLKCTQCGHIDYYDVGRIAYDIKDRSKKKLNSTQDTGEKEFSDPLDMQFGGYFRCNHCNSGGPWKIPSHTLRELKVEIMSSFLAASFKLEALNQSKVIYGKMVSEDGYYYTWLTDYEEHYLNKLSQNPINALIWNRLGNSYFRAGRSDLAAVAYEQAIRHDSKQMESHYSLGHILLDNGDREAGIVHLRLTLMTAHTYPYLDPADMRDMLAETLIMLIEEIENNEQLAEWLPLREEIEAYSGGAFNSSQISEISEIVLDLDTEDITSLYPLAEMYMGKWNEKLLTKKRSVRLNKVVVHSKKKKPTKKSKHKKASKK